MVGMMVEQKVQLRVESKVARMVGSTDVDLADSMAVP